MNLRLVMEDIPKDEHPQSIMRRLGITYQYATPQSLYEVWWFWNCKNVPAKLPHYLKILDMSPYTAVGSGLSLEEADRISGKRQKEKE